MRCSYKYYAAKFSETAENHNSVPEQRTMWKSSDIL
jgi:hypothetical protein